MQSANGIIIELLESREAMRCFVDVASIDDMFYCLYHTTFTVVDGSAPILDTCLYFGEIKS